MKIKKILSSVIALVMLFALFSCNTDGNDNSGDDNGPYKTKKRYFYEYFDTAGAFYDYTVKNEKEFEKLAEGVATSSAMLTLAEKVGVELPITQTVYNVINGIITKDEAIKRLFARENINEF